MVEHLASWVLAAMMTWVPLQQSDAELARYDAMAHDFAAVALDSSEEPPFSGDLGRAKTALLMASIASFESGYRADVDDGRTTGDHGHSYCIMQVQVIGKTREGWTGQDLTSDRKKCIRVALRHIRESFRWCQASAQEDRLAGYTVGSCKPNERFSRDRMLRAKWFWNKSPFDPPPGLTASSGDAWPMEAR
jgi:hypothetical protein